MMMKAPPSRQAKDVTVKSHIGRFRVFAGDLPFSQEKVKGL
jgi:hypothetical protein